jgi:hypothetical protein
MGNTSTVREDRSVDRLKGQVASKAKPRKKIKLLDNVVLV